jgi:hypothetical protein
VKAYRETGEGWQTRINADLRRARKLNVRPAASPRSAARLACAENSVGNCPFAGESFVEVDE